MAPTWLITMKFDISDLHQTLSANTKFVSGNLDEKLSAFFFIFGRNVYFNFNLLKPTGYAIRHQFDIQQL